MPSDGTVEKETNVTRLSRRLLREFFSPEHVQVFLFFCIIYSVIEPILIMEFEINPFIPDLFFFSFYVVVFAIAIQADYRLEEDRSFLISADAFTPRIKGCYVYSKVCLWILTACPLILFVSFTYPRWIYF